MFLYCILQKALLVSPCRFLHTVVVWTNGAKHRSQIIAKTQQLAVINWFRFLLKRRKARHLQGITHDLSESSLVYLSSRPHKGYRTSDCPWCHRADRSPHLASPQPHPSSGTPARWRGTPVLVVPRFPNGKVTALGAVYLPKLKVTKNHPKKPTKKTPKTIQKKKLYKTNQNHPKSTHRPHPYTWWPRWRHTSSARPKCIAFSLQKE